MKKEEEYIKDLTEIRTMMERSTKFLSLTGWSGILAGLYALIGAFISYRLFYNTHGSIISNTIDREEISQNVSGLFLVAFIVFVLAMGTSVLLSFVKSKKRGEKLWNPASRRLLLNMTIPLVTGGIFIMILFSKGFYDLLAPASLVFYGLTLINAGKFTYDEVKIVGYVEIVLGLVGLYFVGYGLLLWAIGFGLIHIFYGLYMHYKYEK
ncbi:MAG TPA: hypothetical protein VFM70_10785 [Salinimicrobium sp.]|nr:hypothetical protein [Salinimicrobium sp.]